MQPPLQIAYSKQAMFSIAHFVEIRGRTEIKISGLLKTEVALAKIALALPGIERDLHTMIVAVNQISGT